MAKRRLITRRRFLAALATAPILPAFGAGYTRFMEPCWFDVTQKNLSLQDRHGRFRILHLSDFHASPVFTLDSIEAAIELGIRQKPDLIFLTGDFITWKIDAQDRSRYSAMLRKLSAAAPAIACLGNHDGGNWAKRSRGYPDHSVVEGILADANVRLLINESVEIGVRKHTCQVAGLGDFWSGNFHPERVLSRQPKRQRTSPVFVLCHNPDAKKRLFDYDWDLACCGHTHGGQFIVPLFGWRPILPVRDKTFPEGLRSWDRKHIHITRGVGCLHGIRFNCRPEISVLDVAGLSAG